jgi:hypothetical protein
MENQKVIKAAMAIKKAMLKNAHWHIGQHEDGSPALNTDALFEELEQGMIGGWLGLPEVDKCNLSEWSGAIELVINQERNKQESVDRFDLTNKYDR